MDSSREHPRARLLAVQRNVHESLKREADRLLDLSPPSIRAYEKTYQKEFRPLPKRPKLVPKQTLIEAIQSSQVTLVADYHTFRQAQRTALRLAREAFDPSHIWWLGLELVSSHFQKDLDDFQAGKITLARFHQQIRYREEWGFPWGHYAPLFEWAKENGVRLLALNRPRDLYKSSASLRRARSDSELLTRDQWAAGLITDAFLELPPADRKNARMLVLYGELHLAERHLPSQIDLVSTRALGRPLSHVIVHQNHDELYWRLAELGREHESGIVRLDSRKFCVLSAPPWSKLQSLVSWAEGAPYTDVVEQEDWEDQEPVFDHLSRIYECGSTISQFMGLAPIDLSNLSVRTIEQADFPASLPAFIRRGEISLIRQLIKRNERFLVPAAARGEESLAYLGTPSANAAAEIAAIQLLHQHGRWLKADPLKDRGRLFHRMTLEWAFGFFGSLILNPRRKCDLIQDHKRWIKRPRHLDPIELKARKLVVHLLAAPLGAEPSNKENPLVICLAARYVGKILGRKLYQAVMEERISVAEVRKVFFASYRAEDEATGEDRRFAERSRFLALCRMTADIRIPSSKSEAL